MSSMGGRGPDRAGEDQRPRLSDEELSRRLATLLRARAAVTTPTRQEASARVRAARLAAASGRRRIVRRAAVLGLAAVLATAGLGAAFLLARPPSPNPPPTASLQADRTTPSPQPTSSPSATPSSTPLPTAGRSPTPQPTPAQLAATFHLRPATLASDAIAFGDPLHGWAVGDGTILATRDGGATWGAVWHGTADVVEVQAISATAAWALAQPPRSGGAGPGGLDTDILLTLTDGGRTWRTIQLRSPLSDLQLVGEREAWALSLATQGPVEPQHLMHTTDGGVTWRKATSGAFRSVCFADAQRGWAIGSNVLRTTDGGAHWVSMGRMPVAADQSLRLTCKGGALWLLGGTDSGPFDYVLRRSTDDGTTWAEVLASTADGQPAGVAMGPDQIGPFDAPDAATAFVAGTTADGTAMTTSVTHDGGQTWTTKRFVLLQMGPLTVAAPDGTHLWVAVGLPVGGGSEPYGLLVASQDGGTTWQEHWPTAALRPLESLDFVSAVSGFGLGTFGDPGAVLRTAEGGRAWQLVGRLVRTPKVAGEAVSEPTGAGSTEAPPIGPSFSFVDLQDGWVLDGTGLERTTDGGADWTTVTLPSEAATPYAVAFRDARDGCLLAADRNDFFGAFRTSDGGLTWSAAPGAQGSVQACAWGDSGAALLASARQATGLTTDLDLSGLAIADPRHAWAVGPDGILRTEDGGAHWQMLGWSSALSPEPFDGGVVAMSFPDSEDGWILTLAGRELQTRDAGQTWTELP